MSNLKDIFGEVEVILVENQEKRESIRDAAKELEAKVIASMQVSTFRPRVVRTICPLRVPSTARFRPEFMVLELNRHAYEFHKNHF